VRRGSEATSGVVEECRRRGADCAQVFLSNPRGWAAALLEEAGDAHLGICLDVCHLFATGYSLDEPGGVEALFAELAAHGLTDRVALVHANDSEFPRGDRRDRHSPIGEGHVGVEGWRVLLSRSEAAAWPFVLETPGDAESHAAQIALLRALAPASRSGPSDQGWNSARGPSW